MRRTPQQKSTKAKSFGANIFMHCILLLWESQKRRSEPNILTWCCAAFRRAFFPQSLPRFYPSDRRAASIEKNKTPYSAVSASGLFTPFLCICANAQTVFRMLYSYSVHYYVPFCTICQYFYAKKGR